MDVNGPSMANSALNGVQSTTDNKRAQLQTMLLKKALDSQQGEAAQLMQMFEGKGQNLDVRV